MANPRFSKADRDQMRVRFQLERHSFEPGTRHCRVPNFSGDAHQHRAARQCLAGENQAGGQPRETPPGSAGQRQRHDGARPFRREIARPARHARTRHHARRRGHYCWPPRQGNDRRLAHPAGPTGNNQRNLTMRILIADDHAVVRRGLKQILADEFKQAHFGEAANAREALDRLRKENWDAVVLDITMPGRSGLEALKEIREEKPKLPVLVLSMHPEDQFAVRVLKSGASGYMTKESAPEELVGAIKKVLAGGRYVSPSLAEKMAAYLAIDTPKPPHERLSDREFAVLRMIASGKTVSQIAVELSLSVKTVSTYRTRILEKTGMTSNAELTHYAIKNQLVE